MDIDIQNYAGETVPAAVEQPESSANSYQNELDDAGIVHQELLEVPKSAPNEQPAAHPQAEHFKALREEVSALKTKMETDRLQHEEQMALLRANTASREAPVRQKEVMFDGIGISIAYRRAPSSAILSRLC